MIIYIKMLYIYIITKHLKNKAFIQEFATLIYETKEEYINKLNIETLKLFNNVFIINAINNDNEYELLLNKCLDNIRVYIPINNLIDLCKNIVLLDKNTTKLNNIDLIPNKLKMKIKILQIIKDQIDDKSQKFNIEKTCYILETLIIPIHKQYICTKHNEYTLTQTILILLDSCVRRFMHGKLGDFIKISNMLTNIFNDLVNTLKTKLFDSILVQSNLLLCISTFVFVLKKKIFSQFVTLMKINLSILNSFIMKSKDKMQIDDNKNILIICVISLFETLLKTFPNYINNFIEKILLNILSKPILSLLGKNNMSDKGKSLTIYIECIK